MTHPSVNHLFAKLCSVLSLQLYTGYEYGLHVPSSFIIYNIEGKITEC